MVIRELPASDNPFSERLAATIARRHRSRLVSLALHLEHSFGKVTDGAIFPPSILNPYRSGEFLDLYPIVFSAKLYMYMFLSDFKKLCSPACFCYLHQAELICAISLVVRVGHTPPFFCVCITRTSDTRGPIYFLLDTR